MNKFVFVLLLVVAAVALFGCAQVRDQDDPKGWPPPEDWERDMGIGPLARGWHGHSAS